MNYIGQDGFHNFGKETVNNSIMGLAVNEKNIYHKWRNKMSVITIPGPVPNNC